MFSSMVSAASKLVAGANLPYELGEEYASFAGKTPWRLYAGKSRKLECDVTVFLYDIKKGTDAQTELARNAMRRYRTLKHPYCVKCLDAGELADNGLIFLLTEPVTPLADALAELSRTPSSLVWGLYTLAAAVNFLSIDCKMVHGMVSLSSIFVDKGMDWKLGGFEMAIEADRADMAYYGRAREALPKRYQSPELARGNIDVLRNLPVAADWWALGCTMFEIFCGEIRSPADLKKIGDMPEHLKNDYMRLLSANTAQRLRPIELLQNGVFDDDYVPPPPVARRQPAGERLPTLCLCGGRSPSTSSSRLSTSRMPSRRIASSRSSPSASRRCLAQLHSGRSSPR